MMVSMASWQSLLYCTQADVTLDRIRSLIAVTGTEPVEVDFKQSATPRIAECAAAMANTYGGLIFVGVTDKEREIVGVPREMIGNISGYLADRLEPFGWLTDMFEVPLGDECPDKYVIVIRVRREEAPRPVFVQVTAKFTSEKREIYLAPVRVPGDTRQATRDELEALFAERAAGGEADYAWDFNRPDIPTSPDGGKDKAVDFVMLSGLRSRVGAAAWGRPISQRAVGNLAAALNGSALARFLGSLTRGIGNNLEQFHYEGHNRSNVANLVWRVLGDPGEPIPFEMRAHIEVPGHYGHSDVGALAMTLTVTSRLTAFLNAGHSSEPPPPVRRWLEVNQWAGLLGSLAATLASPDVAAPIADIAGIDPIEVRQPRVLHISSGPTMRGLLPPQLMPVPDTGHSYGAHMQADPVLDLTDPQERAEQVDLWLSQMAIDAGLLGMDELVSKWRQNLREPGDS
jgi:hypothetical protein